MKPSILRLDYSTYQAHHFPQSEKQAFESMGLHYHYRQEEVPKGELILISNTQTNLDELPPEVWARTQLLVHPNSGYDNISSEFLNQCSFPIIVGNPLRAQAVASYILSQIYHHFNPPPHSEQWRPGRQWPRRPMRELKVLLIGMGHIGSLVYKALTPVVKNIHCYDPFKGYKLDNIIEQAREADIVLPLCSLNPTSQYIVNRQLLEALPEDFTLINGARGKLVDQKALIEILNYRPKAFAYLDVFEREPFERKDFQNLKNANIKFSSHVAGVFDGLSEDILKFNTSVCRDFINSKSVCLTKYKDLVLQHRLINGTLI